MFPVFDRIFYTDYGFFQIFPDFSGFFFNFLTSEFHSLCKYRVSVLSVILCSGHFGQFESLQIYISAPSILIILVICGIDYTVWIDLGRIQSFSSYLLFLCLTRVRAIQERLTVVKRSANLEIAVLFHSSYRREKKRGNFKICNLFDYPVGISLPMTCLLSCLLGKISMERHLHFLMLKWN